MIEDIDENPSSKYSDLFPELKELSNSLVVLDDIENIPVKLLDSYMNRILNVLIQNGRNYKIQIVLILHHLNKGSVSTPLIKEADGIVIFPDSFDFNMLNTLINHYGFSKKKALALFQLHEKFVFIRNSNPMYLFGGSTLKKYPINKI
jgi:predicted ATP-dependent serine protease